MLLILIRGIEEIPSTDIGFQACVYCCLIVEIVEHFYLKCYDEMKQFYLVILLLFYI